MGDLGGPTRPYTRQPQRSTRDAEETIPCPSCGAAVGQRCRFPSGAISPWSCAARWHAAAKAGLLDTT